MPSNSTPETQKYFIYVDQNASRFKNEIIISFTSLLNEKHISEIEIYSTQCFIIRIKHAISNYLKKYENNLFL